MQDDNPSAPSLPTGITAALIDALLPTPPPEKPLLELSQCPSFETRGVSLRVIRHFAAEIRTASLRTGMRSTMQISQVYEFMIRNIVEPCGFHSLVEMTDEVLTNMVTAMTVAVDIGEATHYVVCNHDERFLTLADALFKRFGGNEESDGVYFWIDQFCMPLSISSQFPTKWFANEMKTGSNGAMRTIKHLLVVLLPNDGFTSTSQPEWRSSGLLKKIECLVPLAIFKFWRASTMEILQDDDGVASMREALLSDVETTLGSFEPIKSILLDDNYERTKWFHAAGFFQEGDRERHEAVDVAVRTLLRGWLWIESKQLLEEQVECLDVEVAKSKVGSLDLERVYSFVSKMACLLWKTKTSGRCGSGGDRADANQERAIELLQMVLRSSNESLGTLSSFSVDAAARLKSWLATRGRWQEVEPLLMLTLAEARALPTTSAAREEKVRALVKELGDVMVQQGRDEEAYPLLLEAHGLSAVESLACLERRAERRMAIGKRQESREMYGMIIKNCDEKTSRHPTVLRAATIIAGHLLLVAGDRRQALVLYKRICQGYLFSYGDQHYQTKLAHRKVAMLLWEDQMFDEMAMYVRVADGKRDDETGEDGTGEESIVVDAVPTEAVDEEWCNTIAWWRIRGDYCRKVLQSPEEAVVSYSCAFQACGDKKSSNFGLSLMADLGAMEQELVHLEKARKWYRRYLVHCREDTSTEALRVTVDLAWVYTSLGKHAEAEPLFRRHFVATATLNGGHHPLVNRARARLADCLESQGRIDEALQLQHSNAAVGHFQQSSVVLGLIKN